jgi:hypothetical protein
MIPAAVVCTWPNNGRNIVQLKSILCPIDFSDFSAAGYQHALSLADYYKARVVALHLVELWQYPFADYAAQTLPGARDPHLERKC